jgi:AcrR family transcriptional regulator
MRVILPTQIERYLYLIRRISSTSVPRPQRFDSDQLLDAALALAHESGPADVSMAGAARRAGAPSGSLYHRFPGRAALLGELWLRTILRFHEGYIGKLAIPEPHQAAAAAARYVVEWSSTRPAEASILLHPRAAYEPAGWPPELVRRADEADRRLRAAIADLISRLGIEPDRVIAALVDLPYAVVRRYIEQGRRLGPDAAGLVEQCATKLLED